jgi:hypothetical protein
MTEPTHTQTAHPTGLPAPAIGPPGALCGGRLPGTSGSGTAWRNRRNRRLALPAALLAVTALLAPPVAADPLIRIDSTFEEFSCSFALAGGGGLYLYGGAGAEGSGSGAFVEDGSGSPVLSGEGGAVEFGDGFRALVDLWPTEGRTASVPLTLMADLALGEPTVEPVLEHGGNSWTRGTLTTQEYEFRNIEVDLPGYTVLGSDGGCNGSRMHFDVTSTDPAATVYTSTQFESGICDIKGIADTRLRFSGQIAAPYLEVVIDDGIDPRKASGPLERGGSGWAATLPLVALNTHEETGDALTVTADLKRVGRMAHERFSEGGFTEQVWAQRHVVEVAVTGSDGSTGTATCDAVDLRTHLTLGPNLWQ